MDLIWDGISSNYKPSPWWFSCRALDHKVRHPSDGTLRWHSLLDIKYPMIWAVRCVLVHLLIYKFLPSGLPHHPSHFVTAQKSKTDASNSELAHFPLGVVVFATIDIPPRNANWHREREHFCCWQLSNPMYYFVLQSVGSAEAVSRPEVMLGGLPSFSQQ